jgi:hypothetical protein
VPFSTAATEFYSQLLSREDVDPVAQQLLLGHLKPLTQAQITALDEPITQAELRRALNSMEDRAPGPDGRTASFWKATWDHTGPQLWRLTQAMEEAHHAPSSFLDGIIRLIHKKGDHLDPANYRPITLLQLHYKVVTKLFANRWRKIAPLYFDLHQVGFVPTRHIGDHVRVVLDTRERARISKGTGAWLFLDFQKAYDRVSWDWLHATVQGIQAGPRFTAWMSLL